MSKNVAELKFEGGWEYAPAPETTPVPLKSKYELFINGKFVAPKNAYRIAAPLRPLINGVKSSMAMQTASVVG